MQGLHHPSWHCIWVHWAAELRKNRGVSYGIDYVNRKMLPCLGSGKSMKSLAIKMFEQQIEMEESSMASDEAQKQR